VKTLTVKVPEVLDARLSALARRKSLKRSVIVRRALSQYLSTNDRGSADSCLDLARDLAGCVSGPRDLSVGRRHLKGYGR
jgi:predicted transcriptional regulator